MNKANIMSKFNAMSLQAKGSVLVFVAGILLVLTGFAVAAIDVGRVFIVRNEMQNVADAAALAGANCLDRQSLAGSTTECTSATSTTLNWDRASAKATDELGRNTADNRAISTTDSGHQIDVGYWNLLTKSPSGGTLSKTFTPLTNDDKPAVRVTITKDVGKNNGPITMLTRWMFGGSDVPMTAKAVAVISSPGSVVPGALIPVAINQCMFDQYWDSVKGQPVLFKSGDVDPYGLSKLGQPWEVRIGSSYHYPSCESGQWTSFQQNANDVPTVRDLIANGNPTALNITDNTWIQPGTKDSLYNSLSSQYPTPPGADVTVVVVNQPSGWSTNTQTPIVGFAGFHIDDIQGGSGKYIQGHFIQGAISSGSSGVGPYYGTYTPPRLAQ
ncbi:pilus assembly protein TadG-related protein [Collimonas antrihumi]|uniref:pilus assembly protein TadG-related protein n=1 Tax=Collimonas antrihumi TaxID=1940615 RepID=UPI001FE41955|nr:pilus assembly protein TadG-related protein [Collimonas antrihumi]